VRDSVGCVTVSAHIPKASRPRYPPGQNLPDLRVVLHDGNAYAQVDPLLTPTACLLPVALRQSLHRAINVTGKSARSHVRCVSDKPVPRQSNSMNEGWD